MSHDDFQLGAEGAPAEAEQIARLRSNVVGICCCVVLAAALTYLLDTGPLVEWIARPQGSGLLIGKEDLIHYALLNMSPQEDRVGRPCKIGKGTIFAFLKSLETFVNQDYDATLKTYGARAQVISEAIKKFGVTANPREFNPNALGNVTPRYSWTIDQTKIKMTGQEVMPALADTRPGAIGSLGAGASGTRGRDPNVEANGQQGGGGGRGGRGGGRGRGARDPNSFGFAVWQIKDGEDKIIADRLVEIFSQAPNA